VPLLGLWVGLIANSFFIDTLHWRHLWLVAGLIWAGASRRGSGQPLGALSRRHMRPGASDRAAHPSSRQQLPTTRASRPGAGAPPSAELSPGAQAR
jgi:hypothetical protein